MSDKTETVNYFIQEYHSFRKIMCSKAYTVEQKSDAYRGLFTVYVNLKTENKKQEEFVKTIMSSLTTEFDMRLGLQCALDIQEIFNQVSSV